jgi:hypothetical protein
MRCRTTCQVWSIFWLTHDIDEGDFDETHTFFCEIATFRALDDPLSGSQDFLPITDSLISSGTPSSWLVLFLILRAIYEPLREGFIPNFEYLSDAIVRGLTLDSPRIVNATCALVEQIADVSPDMSSVLLPQIESQLLHLAAFDCALNALEAVYRTSPLGTTLDGNAVADLLAAQLTGTSPHSNAALCALAELLFTSTVSESRLCQILEFIVGNLASLSSPIVYVFGCLVWRWPLLAAPRVRDLLAAVASGFADADLISRMFVVDQLTNIAPVLCSSFREFAPALDSLLVDFARELLSFPSKDIQIAEASAHECRAAILRFCGGGAQDAAKSLADFLFTKILEDDAGKEAYLRGLADVLIAAGRAGCPWVGELVSELLTEAAGTPRASSSAWMTVRSIIAQTSRAVAASVASDFIDAISIAAAEPVVVPAVFDATATFFLVMRGEVPGDVAATIAGLLSGVRMEKRFRGSVLLAVICVLRWYDTLMAENFDWLLQAVGEELRSPFPESARAALDGLCFLIDANPMGLKTPADRMLLKEARKRAERGEGVEVLEATQSVVRTIARVRTGLFVGEEIEAMIAAIAPSNNSYGVVWDGRFLCWVVTNVPELMRERRGVVLVEMAVKVFILVELLFGLFEGAELMLFAEVMGQVGEDQMRELVNGNEGDLELLKERISALSQ